MSKTVSRQKISAQEYLSFERELSKTEKELTRIKNKRLQLRRRLPWEEVNDYSLKGSEGREVKLSSLFGEKEDLILIHNMGKECPYCTMWADGFNGVLPHLENRAAWAVVSPDDPITQQSFAAQRGWKFKMLSARGTSFTKDMGFEGERGECKPGVSVFRKDKDGKIFRVSKDVFGPGDDYCSVWHFFDLLAGGGGDWEPKFQY